MKHVIRGVGAAAALLAFASPAWAFGPYNNTQVCGGASAYTCVTLTSSYDATTNTLSLDVRLDSGGELHELAVGNAVPTSGTSSGDAAFSFGDQNALTGSGGPLTTATGFKFSGPKLQVGETAHFTFTFDDSFNDDWQNLALGIHTGGFGSCESNKLFVDANNGVNGPDGGAYVEGCGPPTTTVPEPITMSLLATGLAGMGGAGLIRRRSKKA
jgi:hypothetical protein